MVEDALREGLAAGGLAQGAHEAEGLGDRQVRLHLGWGVGVGVGEKGAIYHTKRGRKHQFNKDRGDQWIMFGS